jgi:colicin import membrane protein
MDTASVMSTSGPKICIYPGCTRPAVPPHPLGGPQPAFCELEEHNALTAHQERQRLAAAGEDSVSTPTRESNG